MWLIFTCRLSFWSPAMRLSRGFHFCPQRKGNLHLGSSFFTLLVLVSDSLVESDDEASLSLRNPSEERQDLWWGLGLLPDLTAWGIALWVMNTLSPESLQGTEALWKLSLRVLTHTYQLYIQIDIYNRHTHYFYHYYYTVLTNKTSFSETRKRRHQRWEGLHSYLAPSLDSLALLSWLLRELVRCRDVVWTSFRWTRSRSAEHVCINLTSARASEWEASAPCEDAIAFSEK